MCRETRYDVVFKICAALTNLRVICHPLKIENVQMENSMRSRFHSIVNEAHNKRYDTKATHREKRRRLGMFSFGASEFQGGQPFGSHYYFID